MIRHGFLVRLDDFLHRFGLSYDRLCEAVDRSYGVYDEPEPLGLFLEARYDDDDDAWCE